MDESTALMTLGGSVIGGLVTALLTLWRDRGRMEQWVLAQLAERDARLGRLEQENSRLQTEQLRDVVAALQGASCAMTALANAVRHSECPRLEGLGTDAFTSPDVAPLAGRLAALDPGGPRA